MTRNGIPQGAFLKPVPGQTERLTTKQEMFCQYYASPAEFFGSGTTAYSLAYGYDLTIHKQKNICQVGATQLLAMPKINRRIDQLLDDLGFNDQMADKRLSELMLQRDEKSISLGALREYNKLKARIQEHIDVTSAGQPIVAIEIFPTTVTRENKDDMDQ